MVSKSNFLRKTLNLLTLKTKEEELVFFLILSILGISCSIIGYFYLIPEHLKMYEKNLGYPQTLGNWTFLNVLVYSLIWFFITKVKYLSWKTLLYISVIVFTINACIAIATPPTQSQDPYWNLALSRGWTEQGLDPYKTTINDLSQDEWTTKIIHWRNFSMVYGPLWVLILAPFTALGMSVSTTLVLVKVFLTLLLIPTGFLWWKIMSVKNWPIKIKSQFLILALYSPFVFQVLIVDSHNDIFVLIALLASYYFSITKRYYLSALVLLTGGFIKYIPWFLVLIPVWQLLQSNKSKLKKLFYIASLGVIFFLMALIFYSPFGWPWEYVSSFKNVLVSNNLKDFQMLTTYIWSYIPFVNPNLLRILGAVIGLSMMVFLLIRSKFLLAYTLPISTVLVFTTPWFMPWYGLWVYPLLTFIISLNLFAILNVSLFVMQIGTPLSGSIVSTVGILCYFLLGYLMKSTKTKL